MNYKFYFVSQMLMSLSILQKFHFCPYWLNYWLTIHWSLLSWIICISKQCSLKTKGHIIIFQRHASCFATFHQETHVYVPYWNCGVKVLLKFLWVNKFLRY